MDEIRAQQVEALEIAVDYIAKLVPAFRTVAGELKGEKQEDTMDFLNQAIEGLNFVIEIFNATVDLLHEKEEVFKKDVIEQQIQKLNTAISEHNDVKIADCIEQDIVSFLEIFSKIATVFISNLNPDR